METQLEVLFWFVAKFQDQNAFSLKNSEFSVVKETGPEVHSTSEAELPVVSSFDAVTDLSERGGESPTFLLCGHFPWWILLHMCFELRVYRPSTFRFWCDGYSV